MERIDPIPTAMMPPRTITPADAGIAAASADDQAAVVLQAQSYIDQWKLERVSQQQTIEGLQIELAELTLTLQSERRKTAALELELAEASNNLQTQQSQIEEYRRFMSVWKEMNDRTRAVFDRFGVQSPPKKERKPKTSDVAP